MHFSGRLSLFRVNRHSTSSTPEGPQRPATLRRPAAPHPHFGAEMGCKVGLWRLFGGLSPLTLFYIYIPWPSCVFPVFPLHWFWPPTAKQMPPFCLLQRHRVGFQPSVVGWLVEDDLLCAKPPHVCQKPTGGPLDVIRRPPFGLHCAYSHRWEDISTRLQNICRDRSRGQKYGFHAVGISIVD